MKAVRFLSSPATTRNPVSPVTPVSLDLLRRLEERRASEWAEATPGTLADLEGRRRLEIARRQLWRVQDMLRACERGSVAVQYGLQTAALALVLLASIGLANATLRVMAGDTLANLAEPTATVLSCDADGRCRPGQE